MMNNIERHPFDTLLSSIIDVINVNITTILEDPAAYDLNPDVFGRDDVSDSVMSIVDTLIFAITDQFAVDPDALVDPNHPHNA